MRFLSCSSFALLAGAVILVAGCSSSPYAEVHGSVTVDGQPVEKGSIRFEPLDGKSTSEGGVIENGKYTVAKVPIGTVKVDIRVPKVTGKKQLYGPGSQEVPTYSETLPKRYNAESVLQFDVPARQQHERLGTFDPDAVTRACRS